MSARLRWLVIPLLLCLPASAFGWGANSHRLITNKAVDTLPPEIRGFFDANRNFLVQKCTLPLETLAQNVRERPNHFIYLDRYGRFPFENLPRDYNSAVRKHGRRMIEANGKLPWQIGYYSLQLREAFEARNWEEAKMMAALLAYYVGAAHDPFNTTENHDGNLSGQTGVNRRFSTSLVDRYQLFFFIRANEATEVPDPTDRAFEISLSAHSWIENILLADRRARRGLNDFTDEYYDRFYNQAGAILLRQISDASSEVGSYWLSAWIHAGKPQLPSH
jgi:hypothetical protein